MTFVSEWLFVLEWSIILRGCSLKEGLSLGLLSLVSFLFMLRVFSFVSFSVSLCFLFVSYLILLSFSGCAFVLVAFSVRAARVRVFRV